MSSGVSIFSAAGATTYTSTDVTWNQVDFFYVSGGGSATGTYPVLSGREVLTAQLLIDAPPTDRKAIAHTVSVSGTVVTASGGSENAYILVLMR